METSCELWSQFDSHCTNTCFEVKSIRTRMTGAKNDVEVLDSLLIASNNTQQQRCEGFGVQESNPIRV